MAQHMCCLINGDGEVPLALVAPDNVKSMSLFQSLSFVQSDFQAAVLRRSRTRDNDCLCMYVYIYVCVVCVCVSVCLSVPAVPVTAGKQLQ